MKSKSVAAIVVVLVALFFVSFAVTGNSVFDNFAETVGDWFGGSEEEFDDDVIFDDVGVEEEVIFVDGTTEDLIGYVGNPPGDTAAGLLFLGDGGSPASLSFIVGRGKAGTGSQEIEFRDQLERGVVVNEFG